MIIIIQVTIDDNVKKLNLLDQLKPEDIPIVLNLPIV